MTHLLGTAITAAQTLSAPHSNIVHGGEIGSLTPEYEMQWGQVQPTEGVFTWTNMDTISAYASAEDLSLHGHCLVWHASGNTDLMPAWVTGGTWTSGTLSAALEDHISAVVDRYKTVIRSWSVANEAFNSDGTRYDWVLQDVIGDEWVELSFEYAHAADPTAELIYNDYSIDWGWFGGNDKYTATLAMLDDYVGRGVPVHGVGVQGHYDLQYTDYPHPVDYPAVLASYANLGLRVHVTELDCRTDNVAGTPSEKLAAQAVVFARSRSGIEEHAHSSLTVWGLSDSTNWLGAGAQAAPLDTGYRDKPAWTEIHDFDPVSRRVSPQRNFGGWGTA